MKHAGIVPLIGGEILASADAYGTDPEYLMTYSGFMANETHLLNYYKEQGKDIPYHVLDETSEKMENVDIVSSVCPCAGLSTYHNFHFDLEVVLAPIDFGLVLNGGAQYNKLALSLH